ncbi:MAG: DUF2007 domain-containing protein [Mariniblastus sp.]
MAVLAGILGVIDLTLGRSYVMPTVSIFVLLLGISFAILAYSFVRDTFKKLPEDSSRPVKLETFNDNIQASLLVAWLEEYGVASTAVGSFVSGFQAESPGYVDVVVSEKDLIEAQDLLEEWRKDNQ